MSDLPDSPNGEVIDVSDRTVMPGIIDCHVHLSIDGDADPIGQVVNDTAAMSVLRMARNAERTIAAGVTTVRDLGARITSIFPSGVRSPKAWRRLRRA